MIKVVSLLLLTVIFLGIVFNLSSCRYSPNELETFFNEWTPEMDADVAVFNNALADAYMFWKGKDVCIENVLKEHEIESPDFIAEVDGIFYGYGIKEESWNNYKSEGKITLFALDLEEEKIEVLHIDSYGPSHILEDYYYEFYNDYVHHYYKDGNVFLFDGVKTIKYNINTSNIEYLSAESFSYPRKYTCERIDGEYSFDKVKIVRGSEERIITVDYMAERNEYANRLLSLKNETDRFGKQQNSDALRKFFSRVVIFDEEIYLICKVYDCFNEGNFVIFFYDYDQDDFKFVYHKYRTGNGSKISIIPSR